MFVTLGTKRVKDIIKLSLFEIIADLSTPSTPSVRPLHLPLVGKGPLTIGPMASRNVQLTVLCQVHLE